MLKFAKRFAFVVLLVAVVIGGVWAFETMKVNSYDLQIVVGLLGAGAIVCALFVFVWTQWDLTDTQPLAVSKPEPSQVRETDTVRWKTMVRSDAQQARVRRSFSD